MSLIEHLVLRCLIHAVQPESICPGFSNVTMCKYYNI